MKKILKVIGALLLLGLIAIGIACWYACTSNLLAVTQDISGCQQV